LRVLGDCERTIAAEDPTLGGGAVCSSVQAFSTASHEARRSTDLVRPEHWMSGGKQVPQRTNFLNSSFPRVGGSDGGREEVEGYSLNISNCPPDLPDSAVLHGVFVFAHHYYGTKDARLGDYGPKGRSDSH